MEHFELLVLYNSACFSSMSHKLSSSISKVGHNVGEINWHISALKVVKFMPRKFLHCLSSAWLTGLIAERSHVSPSIICKKIPIIIKLNKFIFLKSEAKASIW